MANFRFIQELWQIRSGVMTDHSLCAKILAEAGLRNIQLIQFTKDITQLKQFE